ncbi:ATP-binding cassette domain-containing protein [Exilibacterium tricleocarpae]|uniref:ATP-binding cassette domain-containing protein n=1 Tax=Exilibacterium tricleocarpae TaxID=2591008 RepID=A0A545T043_9GAMM|nr:ATP-binding cassette domain-containing protein [Exilibacterium tricleocarpae]TQV70594.1 ATP-binding cassette domain-containing protein [Exilibacterium tricleocarpae]
MVEVSSPALQAESLRKVYGRTVALEGLDLTVSSGEIVCLLGANGAGKSTTISLFLGLTAPTQGRALIQGIDSSKNRLSATRHLAYIPEQVALYPQLTGLENLQTFVRLSGRDQSRSDLLAKLLAAGLDEESAHHRTRTYSKGMRQKVGIAIALARNVDALLLDEPMSGLDPSAANAFGQKLTMLKQQGRAILMVTHDIFRAKIISDRIGIMRNGRLLDIFPTREVEAADLEQIYLSHMAEGAS